MAASVLGNQREFDYINLEIDDTCFQYNTLCLCYIFLHFFLLSVLLKLLKHVRLILFECYNECITQFDKKIAT